MKSKSIVLNTISINFTVTFLMISTTIFSQQTAVWKGGYPGQPSEWNCPKNWSNFKVPDAFSHVIIPDVSSTSLANPVIKNCSVEVNSIFLQSNAKLIIEKDAQLVVNDAQNGFGNESGLILRGTLINTDVEKEIAIKKALAIQKE
jgi:hypothetical protein